MEKAREDKIQGPPMCRAELQSELERSASKVLSAKAAAEALGVSAKTLANWRVSGIGPKFVKLGSRVLYRQVHLNAFLEERTVSSTSQPRDAP